MLPDKGQQELSYNGSVPKSRRGAIGGGVQHLCCRIAPLASCQLEPMRLKNFQFTRINDSIFFGFTKLTEFFQNNFFITQITIGSSLDTFDGRR